MLCKMHAPAMAWQTHKGRLVKLKRNYTTLVLLSNTQCSLELGNESLKCLLFLVTAKDPPGTDLTSQPVPGGASAAVAPAAVGASLGPEAAALTAGSDVREAALHRLLHPSEGSAEGTDDSVWERIHSWLQAQAHCHMFNGQR